jgi:hypothetical protein
MCKRLLKLLRRLFKRDRAIIAATLPRLEVGNVKAQDFALPNGGPKMSVQERTELLNVKPRTAPTQSLSTRMAEPAPSRLSQADCESIYSTASRAGLDSVGARWIGQNLSVASFDKYMLAHRRFA